MTLVLWWIVCLIWTHCNDCLTYMWAKVIFSQSTLFWKTLTQFRCWCEKVTVLRATILKLRQTIICQKAGGAVSNVMAETKTSLKSQRAREFNIYIILYLKVVFSDLSTLSMCISKQIKWILKKAIVKNPTLSCISLQSTHQVEMKTLTSCL